MPVAFPPFWPTFGNGTPGANIPRTAPYFDVSGAIGVEYVWNAGAWHIVGVTGTFDATSIQGTAVDATPPTNGQTLKYVSGSGKWTPS